MLPATAVVIHFQSFMVVEPVLETGGDQHNPIHQNQYTDKAVDLSDVMQEQVSQIQPMHRMSWRGT